MSTETEESGSTPKINSLRDLLDFVSGRSAIESIPQEDAGLAEDLPYPFLAIVGQYEMKLALLLAVINPAVGGVLLIGPRGTGKTTSVRSLSKLLPAIERSACFYGCTREDIETGGMDAVCPECARKFGQGLPLTRTEPGHLVELPLNARLEDVVGGIDERSMAHENLRLKRGILAQADLNILYVDEVNLLANEIVDSILDAAAQGSYMLRRGPNSASYRSRFTLIGSMNPEEGDLRPHFVDRFGLRIIVRGLDNPADRLLTYHRVKDYRRNPRQFIQAFAPQTEIASSEIQAARERLPKIKIPDEVASAAIGLVRELRIDSLRAEISMFEAARAYAASDGRNAVELTDIQTVAPLALRLRSSPFMAQFFSDRAREEQELNKTIRKLSD